MWELTDIFTKIRTSESISPAGFTEKVDSLGCTPLEEEETINILENILGWYLSEVLDESSVHSDSLDEISDMLATVSDMELCYLWQATVGNHYLDKLGLSKNRTDSEIWLSEKLTEVKAGKKSDWKTRFSFEHDRLTMLREDKKELIERMIDSLHYFRLHDMTLGQRLIRSLMEYVDRLTLCAFWDNLCHRKMRNMDLVPDYKKYLGPEDSLKIIRSEIAENNDEVYHEHGYDTIYPLMEDFVAITTISEFWYLNHDDNYWNPEIADPYYTRMRFPTKSEILEDKESRIETEKMLLLKVREYSERLDESRRKRGEALLDSWEKEIEQRESSLEREMSKRRMHSRYIRTYEPKPSPEQEPSPEQSIEELLQQIEEEKYILSELRKVREEEVLLDMWEESIKEEEASLKKRSKSSSSGMRLNSEQRDESEGRDSFIIELAKQIKEEEETKDD